MEASSEARKPPRIAPAVMVEGIIGPIAQGVLGTLAWNFLVAAELGLDTINLFAAIGIAYVVSALGMTAGYALGHGQARRSLQAQEQYGMAAAEYLAAQEAELEAEHHHARGGGQG